MDGKLQKVENGVWFEGMFFENNEIDRIEKSKPAVKRQEVKKSWIDQIKERFQPDNSKEEKASSKSQPPTKKNAKQKRGDFVSKILLGPSDSSVQEGLDAYKDRMSTSANMIERARDLQRQANQQHMRLQMEMMKAYEGEFYEGEVDYNPSTYKQNQTNQNRSNKSKSSSSDRDREYRSKNSQQYRRSSHKPFRSKNIGNVPKSIGRSPAIGPQ